MLLAESFLGGWEILLIIVVVLIVFGAKKFPELFNGLGRGLKEFRNLVGDKRILPHVGNP